jgi:ApbE superfamily uncharacterized protein (UPF0280 family)
VTSKTGPPTFEPRTYRQHCRIPELTAFRVIVKETDLWVHAREDLTAWTREQVLEQRGYLEGWITRYPEFGTTLKPWLIDEPAPAIVTEMVAAGRAAGTGPMAAVAGALAEAVATKLCLRSDAVLVENGGDLFIHYPAPLTIAVAAGPSKLSMRLGIRLDDCSRGRALCTSSGSVGHSLSLGSADAVCVVAACGALADAAATAIGNRVQREADIGPAIEFGRRIAGVQGVLVIRGRASGAWGDLVIEPLKKS